MLQERFSTHTIRDHYNLTQKEFAELLEIPLGTVKNWDARGSMPDYLFFLIKKYLISLDDYRELEKEFFDLRKKYNEICGS